MRTKAWHRTFALTVGLLPTTLLLAAVQPPLHAQEAAKPTVRISPVILAEPEVETALTIEITAPNQVPSQTYLRIKGLPLAAKLSEGHVVTPGVWAIPLAAIGGLRLMTPLAGSGRTELSLALVSVDGGVLAETRSSLVVAPAWLLGTQTQRREAPRQGPIITNAADAGSVVPPPNTAPAIQRADPAPAQPAPLPARSAPAAAPPPPAVAPPTVVAAVTPPPAPAPTRAAPRAETVAPPAVAPTAVPPPAAPAAKSPPVLSAADRARAEGLLQRGETFLVQGNVAAARQFFRRAADIGLPLAALRLGNTYDPAELAALRATGLDADPKEARMWYERARDLGATEATARLSRLQGK